MGKVDFPSVLDGDDFIGGGHEQGKSVKHGGFSTGGSSAEKNVASFLNSEPEISGKVQGDGVVVQQVDGSEWVFSESSNSKGR